MKVYLDGQFFELDLDCETIDGVYQFLKNEELLMGECQFISGGKVLMMTDLVPVDPLYISTKKEIIPIRNTDNMMEMMEGMQPLLKTMDKETFKDFMRSSHKDLTNEQLNGMYDLLKSNSIKQLMQSSDMQMARLDAQGYLGQVMPLMGLEEEVERQQVPINPNVKHIPKSNCTQGQLTSAPMPNPFQLNRNK